MDIREASEGRQSRSESVDREAITRGKERRQPSLARQRSVSSQRESQTGDDDLPITDDPTGAKQFYTKADFQRDAVLIDHYWRNRDSYSDTMVWKYLRAEEAIKAQGIVQLMADSQRQKARAKVNRWTKGQPDFESIDNEQEIRRVIDNFRKGPTQGGQRPLGTFPSLPDIRERSGEYDDSQQGPSGQQATGGRAGFTRLDVTAPHSRIDLFGGRSDIHNPPDTGNRQPLGRAFRLDPAREANYQTRTRAQQGAFTRDEDQEMRNDEQQQRPADRFLSQDIRFQQPFRQHRPSVENHRSAEDLAEMEYCRRRLEELQAPRQAVSPPQQQPAHASRTPPRQQARQRYEPYKSPARQTARNRYFEIHEDNNEGNYTPGGPRPAVRPRQNSDGQQHYKNRSLRATDIMPTGFDPKEITVRFFIDRILDVSEEEGEEEVLRVLPYCLKGRALTWHTGLDRLTKKELRGSINSWVQALNEEYQENQLEAYQRAREMVYQFDDEIDVGTYITEKATCLRSAGHYDDAAIMQQIWDGLPDELAGITPVRPRESLMQFRLRLKENEMAAKRMFQSTRERERRERRRVDRERDYGRSNFRQDARYDPPAERAQQPSRGNQLSDDRRDRPRTTGQAKPEREERKPLAEGRPRGNRLPPRACRGCNDPNGWDKDCPKLGGAGHRRNVNNVDGEYDSGSEYGSDYEDRNQLKSRSHTLGAGNPDDGQPSADNFPSPSKN
jgi:hypothetical protein